jgi:5'(3')-deoxyribonucleotidase
MLKPPSNQTIIAIDIDDVIADTHETMRQWGNRVSGVTLSVEDAKAHGDYWGYYDRLWTSHNLHHVLRHEDFEQAIEAGEEVVPLLAGAMFAIKELQKIYKVMLITSRRVAFESATRVWISEQFGDQIEIYFAKNDRREGNTKTKGELAVELGVSVLVDDSVGHCTDALQHGIKAILFGDYGWQHSVPTGTVRCKDWPSVLEYFNGQAA